jgi:KRAB domain-containing zinc finger protein
MSIVRHVEDHRLEATLQCIHCCKKFKGRFALRDHIRYIHDAELIKCEICGAVRKQHIMVSHMKYVHSEERNHNCPICGASFKSRDKLKRHVKSHDKKIECTICGRKFVAPHELKEHMMRHENPNIYSCDACKKSFSSRTCLRTHSRLHCDKANKVKNLQCDYCPFATHNYLSIVYHVVAHIKRKERFKSIVGGVECKICGMIMKKKSLWGHMKMHKNVQKITCDKCGIEVSRKESFIKHFQLKHA